MFSTQGQEVKGEGLSKSLQPGVVYAHIFGGRVITSKSGDKKVLELTLEGPALPNFEGWAVDKNDPEGQKFAGQSSRVTATSWTDQFNDPNPNKNEIMGKLTVIAQQLGLRPELDQIQAQTIEDWSAQAIELLKGHDVYFFLKGTEEEYNGKTIVKLSFTKIKFCAADDSKLDKFDKSNKYHYKPLEAKAVSTFAPASTDFDM